MRLITDIHASGYCLFIHARKTKKNYDSSDADAYDRHDEIDVSKDAIG